MNRNDPNDPYNLRRFETAQEPIYGDVLEELARGRKQSHWMWFVFPQIEGLGSSGTARAFAISSLAEARAYLEHPILGARLRECTRLVLGLEGRSAEEIFGGIDSTKFRSSMTLFSAANPDNIFADALAKYFGGYDDPLTMEILAAGPAF